MRVWPGRPYPLGTTWDGAGVNFALFSEHAAKIELCLFDGPEAPAESHRIVLPEIKTEYTAPRCIPSLDRLAIALKLPPRGGEVRIARVRSYARRRSCLSIACCSVEYDCRPMKMSRTRPWSSSTTVVGRP